MIIHSTSVGRQGAEITSKAPSRTASRYSSQFVKRFTITIRVFRLACRGAISKHGNPHQPASERRRSIRRFPGPGFLRIRERSRRRSVPAPAFSKCCTAPAALPCPPKQSQFAREHSFAPSHVLKCYCEKIPARRGRRSSLARRGPMAEKENYRIQNEHYVQQRVAECVFFVDWVHGLGESCSPLALPRARCFTRRSAQAGFSFRLQRFLGGIVSGGGSPPTGAAVGLLGKCAPRRRPGALLLQSPQARARTLARDFTMR